MFIYILKRLRFNYLHFLCTIRIPKKLGSFVYFKLPSLNIKNNY